MVAGRDEGGVGSAKRRWDRQLRAWHPSREDYGCHGPGDGTPPQRSTSREEGGGGAGRGGGARDGRRPTGTEDTSSSAGCCCGSWAATAGDGTGWLPRTPRCSLSLPSLGDDAGHDVTLDSVPAQVRLGSERVREREREKEAEAELFSQSARLHRAVEGKWELDGAGDAKLFHNSGTGLSSFTFVCEHNHQSLSSDIVDDAPYCELKLRLLLAQTLWFSASSDVRFQGLLREVQ